MPSNVPADVQRELVALRARIAELELNHIFDASLEAVVTVDSEQCIKSFNRGAERLFGYSTDEIIGNPLNLLIPESAKAVHTGHVDEFAKQHASALFGDNRKSVSGLRKNGTVFPAEVTIVRKDLPSGTHFTAVLRDLSQQELAESALRERDERLSMLFNESADAVVLVGGAVPGQINDFNDRALDLFGYSRSAFANLTYFDLLEPGDIERVPVPTAEHTAGEVTQSRRRMIRKDGSIMTIDARGRRLSNGQTIVTLRDITQQIQAEQAVSDRDERLRVLFEEAADPILVAPNGDTSRFVDFNQAAIEFFGYSAEELRAIGYEGLLVPGELGQHPIYPGGLKPGETAIRERRVRKKDGSTSVVEARAKRLSGDQSDLGIIVLQDISDRIEADRALRDSERRLSHAQQLAKVSGWSWNPADDGLRWSGPMKEIFGQEPPPNMTLRRFLKLLHPKERKLVLPAFDASFRNKTSYNVELGVVVPGSKTRFIHVWAEPEWDEAGRPLLMSGAVQDVTAVKEAEQAVRETRLNLETAQRITHIGSFSNDLVSGHALWSDEMYRILGLEPQSHEPTNDLLYKYVHTDDRARLKAEAVAAARVDELFEVEFRVIREDGSERIVHSVRELTRDEDGPAIRGVGTVQDVTELREAERALVESQKQLQQSQRIESLGLMAGGIAHDFNNLLAAVMGNAAYLRMTLPEHDAAQEVVAEIEQEAEKGAALVRQLLAFSKRQELKPQFVDIDSAVSEFLNMARRILSDGIKVAMVVVDRVPPISIDPGQLDQILMNLIVNARHAMPAGGTVTIKIANAVLGKREATRLAAVPGEYVALTVTDTGHGMNSETLAHLFEPFYSTKPADEGTGLGLSTVHGIVSQSGGYIRVESQVGSGTTFTILFPKADSEEPPAPTTV